MADLHIWEPVAPCLLGAFSLPLHVTILNFTELTSVNYSPQIHSPLKLKYFEILIINFEAPMIARRPHLRHVWYGKSATVLKTFLSQTLNFENLRVVDFRDYFENVTMYFIKLTTHPYRHIFQIGKIKFTGAVINYRY